MEKQIEEMAKDICHVKGGCEDVCNPTEKCRAFIYSRRAYEKGYRRASDVAREIIEDLTRMVFSKIPNKLLLISGGRDFTDGIIDGKREAYFDMLNYLAELKKKYESEGEK